MHLGDTDLRVHGGDEPKRQWLREHLKEPLEYVEVGRPADRGACALLAAEGLPKAAAVPVERQMRSSRPWRKRG